MRIILYIFSFLTLLAGCGAEHDTAITETQLAPDARAAAMADADSTTAQDEFASSMRVRNSEIRDDLLAELTRQSIPYRLNDDGSIGYREVDGEAIDAAFYYVVGLYAARN